jgi:hypothetical protein
MRLLELFCDVDDFWLRFAPQWKVSQRAASSESGRASSVPAR